MKSIIKYEKWEDISSKKGILINDADWGRKGHKIPVSSINSISSYLAMSTPAISEWFIKKYSKKNDVVYDPFCGRGTTLMRAKEMGRQSYGADLNPYAIVLSRFKIAQIKNKEILIKKVNELEASFNKWYLLNKTETNKQKYEELRIYYSNTVLSSLIFLREKLGKKWKTLNNEENAIIAICFGLMHGKIRKDNTSLYFSLDMPNTISMSPNYVKKYAKNKKLKKPSGFVFDKIRTRIHKKYSKILEEKYNSKVFIHDSTQINSNIPDNSIKLVFTSPPYLNIVDYTNSNWLRLWLLGYERKKIRDQIKLSDKLKFSEYLVFIQNMLKSLEPKMQKEGKICLIVGDVHQRKLIEEVWEKISKIVNYKFIEIYYDYRYHWKNKILNKMNKNNKATMIEKVLVIKKINNSKQKNK